MENILSKAKLYDLLEARDKAKGEHEKLLKKVLTEGNSLGKRTDVIREGKPFRYLGVLQSIREVNRAADEHNANDAHTLTQVRLLFEQGAR